MNIFKRLFKELGYISKNNLIEKAVTIYLNHSGATNDEKEFYYDCGNCNALNYLFDQIGINLTNHVKRENIKRVYGGHERRTDD